MANALYDLGRESFLKGEISWSGDNIKTVLVDTAGYTVNLATDQFLSDIPSGERVATSANLASKTTTNGDADAADGTVYKDSKGKTRKRVSAAGTKRGDAYCARTVSQKRTEKVKVRRKAWGCAGKKSVKK